MEVCVLHNFYVYVYSVPVLDTYSHGGGLMVTTKIECMAKCCKIPQKIGSPVPPYILHMVTN